MKGHLKPGALTSTSLLLDRHDLQNLILQRGPQEEIDDLRLLQESDIELHKAPHHSL